MQYQEHLNRWAIARTFPDLHQEIVARFRTWSDAEGHLRRIHQQTGSKGEFKVVFDVPHEEAIALH